MNQVISYITSFTSQLSQADLIIVAGGLAWGVQWVIRHFQNLSKPLNWLLSFALPWATGLLPLVASHKASLGIYAPLAYFAAQVIYFASEQLKAAGAKSAAPQTF